jgi:hypothetical protein
MPSFYTLFSGYARQKLTFSGFLDSCRACATMLAAEKTKNVHIYKNEGSHKTSAIPHYFYTSLALTMVTAPALGPNCCLAWIRASLFAEEESIALTKITICLPVLPLRAMHS